jgi:hypothetical protein
LADFFANIGDLSIAFISNCMILTIIIAIPAVIERCFLYSTPGKNELKNPAPQMH